VTLNVSADDHYQLHSNNLSPLETNCLFYDHSERLICPWVGRYCGATV